MEEERKDEKNKKSKFNLITHSMCYTLCLTKKFKLKEIPKKSQVNIRICGVGKSGVKQDTRRWNEEKKL